MGISHYGLTVINTYVGLLWVYPSQYATADTTTVGLTKTLLVPFGSPDTIYSDRGTRYSISVVMSLKTGITGNSVLPTVYRQQS